MSTNYEHTPLETFVPPWEHTTFGERLWLLFLQARQVVLLLLLCGLAWWLWMQVKVHTRFPAYARQDIHTLGAPFLGKLASVHVEKGAMVKKGQLLAKMDARLLLMELDIATLEKKRLEQSLISTALQFQLSQVSLQSRLVSLMNSANASWFSEQMRWKTSQAELGALRQELQWMRKVRNQQLGRTNNFGTLEARQKSLSALVEAMPSLLRMYQKRRLLARRFVRDAKISTKQNKEQIEQILKPLQSQWAMQVVRIKKLQHQIEQTSLRSPSDGVVLEILHYEGTQLTQGAPIIRVARENRGIVQAYVEEGLARRIKVGALVQVKPRYAETPKGWWFSSTPTYCAKVTTTGAIEPIPLRFRSIPQKPIYVRPVMLQFVKETPLIPGELMFVEFAPGKCPSTESKKAGAKK